MFRKTVLMAAVATAIAQITTAAQAQVKPPAPPADKPVELPVVVVTGNPLGSELFDLVQPISVLGGQELFQLRRSTLGETLSGLPGVTSTYFGPNASRPVIRGLDGDRIRILQNGSGSIDASSLSYDHAVAIDPLAIERAEVVRGPAALLYGGNAVGGVVNLIDNRIPQAPLNGVTGRAETRYGGADREKASSVLLEAGNGRFAMHADAFTRDTDDLRIKGPNISPRLQALNPALPVTQGTLPNSASRGDGGALGMSLTWDRGFVGLSYGAFGKRYGTVAEPTVEIDMRSQRIDVGGEVRELPWFLTGVKFKLGHTDYRHQEEDLGVPATRFKSKGYDARLEATHANLGPLKGAFGLQLTNFDFSATGVEAFVPSTNTDAKAFFIYEELPLGNFKFTFGGRHERSELRSDGGGPIDPNTGLPRFDPPQKRTFGANSGSLGMLYNFTPGLALAVNGTSTERAPTYYELFANGVHAATGAYEVGNPAFGKEQSRSLDVALRARSGFHSGSIGVYQTRFKNYLAVFNSGNTRGADGELNPVEDPGNPGFSLAGQEILPELVYRAVPARFRGIEADGKFRVLTQAASTLDLRLRFDYVRAEDESTGMPLPRIAPQRLSAGLDYQWNRFGARLDVTHVSGQSRVSANELPTDGYTALNVGLNYRVKAQAVNLDFFVRGVNLLNEDMRNHVSVLKDIAPLGQRSVQVGMRGQF